MRIREPLLAALLCTSIGAGVAQAQEKEPAEPARTSKRPDPTKAQTEEWLKEHIEAWNEGDIEVRVKDCRIVVLDRGRERTEVIDLRGLLLPIEVIKLGGSDAIFRLRVKQKHSGTYGMYRKCDQQNRFCEDGTGKFNRLPWIDLTVTYVSDYRSHSPGVTVDKTYRLERALEHYSRLCGAMEDARNRLF